MVPTIQVLVTRCGLYQATDTETRPITDDFLEMFEAECERFGSCGERVLGRGLHSSTSQLNLSHI
jgi:hypothetical protein